MKLKGKYFRIAAVYSGFALAAAGFAAIYSVTFTGYAVHRQTHGPFNFECGVYRNYALGYLDPAATGDNKLVKHLLCAVGYPVIYRGLKDFSPLEEAPIVSSFLTGLMILVFAVWLYRRTGSFCLVWPVTFLLGFSPGLFMKNYNFHE